MQPAAPDTQRKKVFVSLYIPCLFVGLLGLIRLTESVFNLDWSYYGIVPRNVVGMRGILFAPLLHLDWEHYVSNAVALLVLGSVAIYTYRLIIYRVVLWIWLLDGVGVWLLGRDSIHLGASGLIYGLASFLFFSGVLRRNRALWAVSLLVTVMYGGMIWGMLPYVQHISWEAHLFGFLSGVGLSVYYRKQGPQDDPLPEWYDADDDEDADNVALQPPVVQPRVSYDPLQPQPPDIRPAETPHPFDNPSIDPDDNVPNDQPMFRIHYDYRKKNN